MNLNRTLIKEQAKGLINGKWFQLFIIIFIVLFVSGMLGASSSAATTSREYNHSNDAFSDKNYSYSDGDDDSDDNGDFDDFYGYGGDSDNPLDDFTGKISVVKAGVNSLTADLDEYLSPASAALASITSALSIISFILSATFVTMTGYFVVFIRTGRDITLGADIGAIFKNTFDKTYWHKLLLMFLRTLFTGLLTALFIIPGIIYYYSTSFAFELMCDHPDLSPVEAGKLSRKIIKGNRGELFVLDLSFILWWILMACTFCIAGIYVLPYYFTTRALYYENFVRRALAEGRITEDDFIPMRAKNFNAGYGTQPNYAQSQGTYYQPHNGGNPNNAQHYQQTPPTWNGTGAAPNYNNYAQQQPVTPNEQGTQNQAPTYYNPQPQQAPQEASPTQPYEQSPVDNTSNDDNKVE